MRNAEKIATLLNSAKSPVSLLKSVDEKRKALTQERITKSLRKLGFATSEEVAELRARIEALESESGKSEST